MRKKNLMIITSCLVIFLTSFFVWSYQKTDQISSINQELMRAPTSSGYPAFKLLDATQFTDTMYPWLGFPVTILSEKQLLGGIEEREVPPDELKVKEALLKYKDKKRIILNITQWHIAYEKETNDLAELHVKWYVQLIKWTKEMLPAADVGVLGIPYSPWSALSSTNSHMLNNYQRVTQQLQPLIDAADSLYPQFQVVNNEKNDLFYLMGAQLFIAKTSGKPVYPVISHRKAAKKNDLIEFIPVDLIKQQCSFIKRNADGMVWWSADGELWDDRWYDAVAGQCFL